MVFRNVAAKRTKSVLKPTSLVPLAMLHFAVALALLAYGSAAKPRVIFLIEMEPTKSNRMPGFAPLQGSDSISAWYEKLRTDKDRGVFAYVVFDKSAPTGGTAQIKTTTSFPEINYIKYVVGSGLTNGPFPSIQDAGKLADAQVESGGTIVLFCGYRCSRIVCFGKTIKTVKTLFAIERHTGVNSQLLLTICNRTRLNLESSLATRPDAIAKFQHAFDSVMHPNPQTGQTSRSLNDNHKKPSLNLAVTVVAIAAVLLVLIIIVAVVVMLKKKEAPESNPDNPRNALPRHGGSLASRANPSTARDNDKSGFGIGKSAHRAGR